jgi:hypothetical protein
MVEQNNIMQQMNREEQITRISSSSSALQQEQESLPVTMKCRSSPSGIPSPRIPNIRMGHNQYEYVIRNRMNVSSCILIKYNNNEE